MIDARCDDLPREGPPEPVLLEPAAGAAALPAILHELAGGREQHGVSAADVAPHVGEALGVQIEELVSTDTQAREHAAATGGELGARPGVVVAQRERVKVSAQRLDEKSAHETSVAVSGSSCSPGGT